MDAALLAPAAGLAGLAGLAGGGALLRDRRRTGALLDLAGARGWTCTGRDDTEARRTGPPFGPGRARRAHDVLRGRHRGRPLTAFTWSARTAWVDGDGTRQVRTVRWAVAVLGLPAPLAAVEVVPASPVTRALGRGLLGSIELESEPFGRRYLVTGDPRTAYALLPPRSVQLLLDRPPLALRLADGEALTWAPGRLQARDLVARLDTLADLLDAVPGWVWRDAGATA